MTTDEAEAGPSDAPQIDPRVANLRNRLNEALLELDHGEYFRSRIHGWVAYRADADVELPEGISSRLTSPFDFTRPSNTDDASTVDAFLIAYHAAESLCRHIFAILDGSGPTRSPLIALTELKAGPGFNTRLKETRTLPDEDLTKRLDYVFLPEEMHAVWDAGSGPSIASVQEYLRLWARSLMRFVEEWRNPYNAAKHGLALGARPAQFSFVGTGEDEGQSLTLMNGPILRTVEHEYVLGENGKALKDGSGNKMVRWFWMHRAVDPEELIAQAIITADLLDWLRTIAFSRLLGQPKPVNVRNQPKPLDIQRRNAPGLSFSMDLAALPLPPEAAQAILRDMDSEDDAPAPETD